MCTDSFSTNLMYTPLKKVKHYWYKHKSDQKAFFFLKKIHKSFKLSCIWTSSQFFFQICSSPKGSAITCRLVGRRRSLWTTRPSGPSSYQSSSSSKPNQSWFATWRSAGRSGRSSTSRTGELLFLRKVKTDFLKM